MPMPGMVQNIGTTGIRSGVRWNARNGNLTIPVRPAAANGAVGGKNRPAQHAAVPMTPMAAEDLSATCEVGKTCRKCFKN